MSKNGLVFNSMAISPEVWKNIIINTPEKYKFPIIIGSLTCIVGVDIMDKCFELAGAKLAMENGYNYESPRGAKFTKPTVVL